jgi:hypothetical protein
VAPRSVSRAIAISSMTSGIVDAVDSTQPVSVRSPTVRNRTVRSWTVSPSRVGLKSLSVSSIPSRSNTRRWWEK